MLIINKQRNKDSGPPQEDDKAAEVRQRVLECGSRANIQKRKPWMEGGEVFECQYLKSQ